MKFGYLTDEELDRANLSLPPDDPGNSRILQATKAARPPGIWIGCAEYRVKEWKGLLYPEKTKEGDMLELYTRQFNMMEMNGTHYRIYAPEQIRKWTEKVVRPDFRFLPKFPQTISHDSSGAADPAATTAAFLESVSAFQPFLGPLFLQMSEYYSPVHRRHLFRYLATLPEGFTYFLELRHPQWFTDVFTRNELFTALRDMGIGAVITDTPGHREVAHMALTIPKVMIRFVGRHRHLSTRMRLDAWMQRLKHWLEHGLQDLYFVLHTGLSAPQTAVYAVTELNKLGDFRLEEPQLLALPPGHE